MAVKIIFAVSGGGGFPLQGAYANRIMSMAKGMAQKESRDIGLRFVFLGRNNLKEQRGVYEGIPYRYYLNPGIQQTRLNKPFLYLGGVILATLEFLTLKRTAQTVVIACTHGLLSNPVWWACRLRGIPVIRELNEYPNSVISKGEDKLSRWNRFMTKLLLRPFSGFIAISSSLEKFLRNLFPSKPVLNLPINVQPERFSRTIPAGKKYVTYVGALSDDKDGITYLIKAFNRVKERYPEIILRLVGDFPKTTDKEIIQSLIMETDLGSRIEFTGLLDRARAARCILEAYILVLPRPDSTQAQGGFPTKLGEYLATGIPVIATSVGDIPKFLEDGVNVFMSKPGSVDDLSRQILTIMGNYEHATTIASKGKLLALKNFDYRVQASSIFDFISQFLNVNVQANTDGMRVDK